MGEQGSGIACLDNGRIKEIRIPVLKLRWLTLPAAAILIVPALSWDSPIGWDLEKAGRLGTTAGGLVIQCLGSDAGIANLDQTIEFGNTAE